ncbi:LysM peptidoglycan-binding domain-containing protein [Achromobacter piechaudii]|uniref:LysM peptidoglycan-binding domain-containing protein n=1 Tax=Achromobacter piechaudii TaxID=72556 RepID=UPI003DA8224F
MVAIVSGNSLGLNLTSLGTLGNRGVFGNAGLGRSSDQAYVNVVNGNLVFRTVDDQLAGHGSLFGSVRTYNSQGSLGSSPWSVGAALKSVRLIGQLNAAGSSMVRVDEDGSEQIYKYDATRALYVSSDGAGAYDTLSRDTGSGQYVWTDGASGMVEKYEGSGAGRLLNSVDSSGNTVTYTYGANGKLDRVTDASGGITYYDYSGANLTQIRTASVENGAQVIQTRVRYGYDSLNRLTSVAVDLTPQDNAIADGKVFQTFYTYVGTSNRLANVSQTDGSQQSFTYVQDGANFRVATVTDALGRVTRYAYDTANRKASVTDALGAVTVFENDIEGRLTKVTAPAVDGVAQMTSYAYDVNGNVLSIVEPGGNTIAMTYDSRGNQMSQRDTLGNTVTRTYDAGNRVLTESVYTVPAAGSTAASGALIRRYAYDAAGRLRFALSPEGRITEYRYNATGERAATLQYAGSAYVISGLAATAVPTVPQLVAWAAAADMSRVSRTDFTYDYRGMLQKSTAFAKVTSAGAGVADGSEVVTNYVYDQAGRLLLKVSPTGGNTTYSYDGLGRILSVQDAAGNVTLTQYDDAGNRVIVTQANGLRVVTVYDKAGRQVSQIQQNAAGTAIGETRYAYDANGQLLMTTDPAGARAFALYDAAGRKVADISPLGALTQYRYDAAGRLAQTTQYANAVNLALLVDANGVALNPALGAIVPAASANDRNSWQLYDTSGRLSKTIDPTGAVTENRYDGAGQLVEVVRYATRVATGALGPATKPETVKPAVSAGDARSYRYYTADGLLRGTIDAEGSVVEYTYDNAGRQVSKKTSFNRAGTVPAGGGKFDALIPASVAADISEYWLYNNLGQVAGHVDGAGYLTESVYDGSGNLTTKVRYATATAGAGPTSTLIGLRPASVAADEVFLYSYTQLNQVSSARNAEGTLTLYVYDSMGKLTSMVVAAGTNEARSMLARYDLQGRMVAELSGAGAALLTGNQTQAQIDSIWANYGMRYAYDAVGRRISATDGSNRRTLYYYDAEGRVTHTVNALGYTEERIYDNLGQLVEVVKYSVGIALTGLTGGLVDDTLLTAIAAKVKPTADVRETYTYTADGRRLTETAGDGGGVSHDYDAFGNEVLRTTKLTASLNVATQFSYDRLGRLLYTTADPGGLERVTSREYDAFGRVITTRDGNGNTVSYQYDKLGRTILTQNADGSSTTGIDAFGNVVWQQDALGRRTTFAYNTANRSVTMTTPDGVSVTTTRNRHGQTVAVRDGNGNDTVYTYDASGSLLTTETGGTVVRNTYDKLNRLIETTDARGVRTVHVYTAVGQLYTTTVDVGGLALATNYRYNALGQRYVVTDPNGRQTTYAFDKAGRVTAAYQDAAGLKLRTLYTYDLGGRQLTATAPNGTVTQYTYDKLGRRTQEVVDPTGLKLTTRYVYDANDNVVASIDPNGGVTRYVLDTSNRVILTIDANGGVMESRYDAAGQVTGTTRYSNPIALATLPQAPTEAQVRALLSPVAGDVREFRYYTADGRLAMTVDALGAVVTYRYDANGNVLERVAHANRLAATLIGAAAKPSAPAVDIAHDLRTRTVYDKLNRAVYQLDGTGAVVEQRYDASGSVIERIVYATRLPNTTALTQTAIAAAISTAAAPGRDLRTVNVYDNAGRLTHTMNGVGAVTENIYDKNGNLVRQIQYAKPVAAGASPLTVQGGPDDRTTDWVYDGANRQILTVDATGAAARKVLDANGNVIQVVSYAGRLGNDVPRNAEAMLAAAIASPQDRVLTTAYDRADRAVLVVDALMGVTENRYDAAGNLVGSTRYAGKLTGAELAGQPATALTLTALLARKPGVSAQDRTTRAVFDATGHAVYQIDAGGYVTESNYDTSGRVVLSRRYGVAVTLAGQPTAEQVAAVLAPNAATDRVTTTIYDTAGRVLGSTDGLGKSESYTYDGVGNKRTFTNKLGSRWTYDYDAAGRLLSETTPQVAVVGLNTDAAGNLTLGASVAAAVVTRYEYDGLGNLVGRTEAFGRPEAVTTRYVYDAAGRQIRTIYAPVSVYDPGADNLLTNGATGLAERKEGSPISLTSDVLYDAFGNAVAGRNQAGAVSYKVYDKRGALQYEVNAEGYVTEYERNAQGDVTLQLRYATKTGLAGNGYAGITAAMVSAAVNAPGIDHGGDRGVVSTYDRLGRAVEVSQSQIYGYDSSAAANSQYFVSNRITRNEFDAFGQVVAVRELVNPVSQVWATTTQYYDRLGNVTAKVDALGYVTTMSYDGNGNKTSMREYATAATVWNAQSYTLPVAHENDRVTTYAFDALGRMVSETRVGVEYSGQSSASVQRGDLRTTYGYDVLGNRTRVTDAKGASTYTYYDVLGRVAAIAEPTRSAEVGGAALTPLTTFRRDALGNAIATIQHANGTSVVTETPTGFKATSSAQDRATFVRYDSRGNKIQTTDGNGKSTYASFNAGGQLAKQWRAVTGNDGSVKSWFQAYEYDKLGQQTRVIDPASTSVLKSGVQTGWSSSTKEFQGYYRYRMTGTNTINVNWSSLINASGGLVRVQVYYNTVSTLSTETVPNENAGIGEGGDGGVTTGGTTVTFGSPSVATSRTVDVAAAAAASGVSISWSDNKVEQGGVSQLSYIRIWQQDASGNWVSKWEGSNAEANGSGITDVSQANAGWSDTASQYNAFGEVTRRGVNGGAQEYYEYDNGGNLVRTNAKDGRDQITLYNLQGKATANMTSGGAGGGDVSVAAIKTLQQAAAMSNLRRDDTVYDLLGNVVTTFGAARTVTEGGVSVKRDFTSTTVSSAKLVYLPHPETGGGNGETGENGEPTGIPTWQGNNSVKLDWTDLTALGDGDIRVTMVYESMSGVRRTIAKNYSAYAARAGVTITWDGNASNTLDGGVGKVVSLLVQKKDTGGVFRNVVQQQDTFGNTGNFIDVTAPVDPSTKVRLELRQPNGTWAEVAMVNYGKSYRYDAEGLALGTYEYRVSHIGRDGVVKVTGNGTLSLMAPALSTIGSAMGFGTVSREVFSWPSFGAGVNAQFRYRPAGGGTWTSLPVSARTKGHDGVDWAAFGSGAFDYELLLIDKQTGAAYAHATGRIDKQAAVPDRWVPAVGIAPIAQALTLDSGNTSITWTAPGEYTGSAVLRYRLQGTTGWSQVNMSRALAGGGGGGEGGENGSLVTHFSVAFGTLPAGNYEYDLLYTPAISSSPTLHRIGTISQGATTPGYYYTRYYTVTVPVSVWVPPVPGTGEGGEGGQPGYWRVEYRQEQRSEQVWVPPVVPRPGMTQTTAPYTPGYTIKGSAVQYGVSSTTASNPGPISVSASGSLGVVGTWTPVGANNGGTQASRPTVQRTYDRWGNVLKVTDPRSPYWVTSYTYNAANQMTSEIRPNADGVEGAGPKTYLYYDQNGNNVATRDANGNINGTTFDAGGNRVRETHADGGVYRYNYNALGDKVAWVDALGNTTNYTYDNLARLVLTSHAAVSAYRVSNILNLVANGTKTVIESVTYDELGNKLSSTNGAGEATYFRYDLRGNVTGVRKPGVATELRTAYDARGNKTFEADANGNASTWAYDYFGRLVAHTDIGGAKYSYIYDNASQLLKQTNTRGQSLTYAYDAAGQMTRITDGSLSKVTDYAYDHAGNKVRERTAQGTTVYQSNVMAYDALGRLREVSDGYLRETIDYDANGNRTRVQTQYTDAGRTVRNRDLWYGYDAMNRQTTVDGVNGSLEINASQGHKITYDVMGNRLSDQYWDKAISSNGSTAAGFTKETYAYDTLNRLSSIRRDGLLTDQRFYDGADRVVTSGIDGSYGKAFYDASGLANERKLNVYDAAGRVSNVRAVMMGASGFTNKYNNAYTGYDAAGNVTQYTTEMWDGSHYINTYNYTHARYEGYREATLSGTSTTLDPGLTTYRYDVNGNLIGVTDSKQAKNNQTLVNDANGKILQRVQDGKVTRALIVNGELMGTTGPMVGGDDFSPSFRPIDGGNPSAAPGSYRIQAGDTLQSIAQQAFGDSRLWYLIAEANGLSGDRDLRVGATVTVPNRVTGNHNDYKTFKPYDPGKLIGDTQPTMPMPKADGGGGCGGVGMIIVAVVAVVATVLTAGAMAAPAATLMGMMQAGAATLMGAGAVTGIGAVGIGLAAGAVGSIVSQGVGMALGVQSKLNWAGVATSALGAGVTAGVGAAGNGANFLTSNADLASRGVEVGTMASMARAAVSSTITQGIAVATGLQPKFSWANVAAAGIGAGVGSVVGSKIFPDSKNFGETLSRGFVSGTAAGVAASVLTGGKADYLRIATDAFGNALGNSVVEEMQRAQVSLPKPRADVGRGINVTEEDRLAFMSSPLSLSDRNAETAYFSQRALSGGGGARVNMNGDIDVGIDPSSSKPSSRVLLADSGGESFAVQQAWKKALEIDARDTSSDKGTFLYGLREGRANRSVMDGEPVTISERVGALARDFIVGVKDALLEAPLMGADSVQLTYLTGRAIVTGRAEEFTPWSDTGKFGKNGGTLSEYYSAPLTALADIGTDIFSSKYESAGAGLATLLGGTLAGRAPKLSSLSALEGLGRNRGLIFVNENTGSPRNFKGEIAKDYESATTGAFSDVLSGQRSVPALLYDNKNPNGMPYVKFDGHDLVGGAVELIDAKTRVVPFSRKDGPYISKSVVDGLTRKSEALSQNPDYIGVIEVPSVDARREAVQVLRKLGIDNINVRIRK